MSLTKKRHGDTQFLDGLRGLASMAVVLSHTIFWYFPSMHQGAKAAGSTALALWLFNSPFSFFYKGGYAVSIFFVLSGYVLSTVCLRKKSDIYLARATAKRYVRLGGPVLASVLLCALLQAVGAFKATEWGIRMPLSSAYGGASNLWHTISTATYGAMIYGDRSMNYVLWTISIEFYGSLLIFSTAAIFGFSKQTFRYASTVLFLFFFVQHGQLTYYSMFFAGAALSTLTFEQKESADGSRLWTVVASLLGGLYLGGYASGSASYSYLVRSANFIQHSGVSLNWPITFSCLGAASLLYAVLESRRAKKLLSTRPLIWLGNISYSLYLVHSLVLTSLGALIVHWFGAKFPSFLVCLMAVSLASLALSHVFWRLVDMRFTRLADRLGQFLIREEPARDRTEKLQLNFHDAP